MSFQNEPSKRFLVQNQRLEQIFTVNNKDIRTTLTPFIDTVQNLSLRLETIPY